MVAPPQEVFASQRVIPVESISWIVLLSAQVVRTLPSGPSTLNALPRVWQVAPAIRVSYSCVMSAVSPTNWISSPRDGVARTRTEPRGRRELVVEHEELAVRQELNVMLTLEGQVGSHRRCDREVSACALTVELPDQLPVGRGEWVAVDLDDPAGRPLGHRPAPV